MSNGFRYSLTWDRITAESSEDGETDGNGFVIDGQLIQLYMDVPETHANIYSEVFETLEELLSYVEEYGLWTEWSSTHPTVRDWLCSEPHGSLNDGDEEVIEYNLFVEQGNGSKLTEEQFKELRSLTK